MSKNEYRSFFASVRYFINIRYFIDQHKFSPSNFSVFMGGDNSKMSIINLSILYNDIITACKNVA